MDFAVVQIAIQQVTPVAFVYYDTVILIHRGGIFFVIQYPFDHALYGGHMDFGVAVRISFFQAFNVKGIGKGLLVQHLGGFKGVYGLFAKGATVHQE